VLKLSRLDRARVESRLRLNKTVASRLGGTDGARGTVIINGVENAS